MHATDGSIYWPVAYGRGLLRSNDQAQSWTQVCGAGVIKGSAIIELPDSRLATVGGKGVTVSSDHGVTWTAVLDPAPVPVAGLIYAPARQSFFIWNWDCGNKVLTNAIWRCEYRVEAKLGK